MKRGIKHGQMPGQISKKSKIGLLEKGVLYRGDAPEPRRRTAYKKVVLMKERAVLKHRFQRMLDNE